MSRERPVRGGRSLVSALLAAALAAALAGPLVPAPARASGPPAAFLPTTQVRSGSTGPSGAGRPVPYDQAFDPIIATHPTDPRRIAVSYHRYAATPDECGSPALGSGLRVSRDRGRTWQEAKGQPWAGSGRVPNWHATITWGPGPRPGHARLYWADTTLSGCDFSDHRLSIAWSDDEGDTWSPMFVLRDVPATGEGGYPDITVDRDPSSPNHGVVYAAINWFPSASAEPGLRLIASADHGQTWDRVEVPPVPAPPGYPFAYRIGQRLRAAPDGALVAVWHQVDTTDAGRATIGRAGFGVTRVVYRRQGGRFSVREPQLLRSMSINGVSIGTQTAPGTTDTLRLRPRWTIGLDVDPATGRVLVALSDYDVTPRIGRSRGVVRVGRSDDRGHTWAWTTIGPLPAVGGRRVSPHKPSLAIAGDLVVVGVHGIVDVPFGTPPGRGLATIGESVAVSRDGGVTFTAPEPVLRGRWDLEDLARLGNRAGLRDRMEATADGTLVWAFADGRAGGTGGGAARSRIVVTRIMRVSPALVAGPVTGPEDGRVRRLPS